MRKSDGVSDCTIAAAWRGVQQRAIYEKTDHSEKRGVCCRLFSSCSLRVSQFYRIYGFMVMEHDEKRFRCFSSWFGFTLVAVR